MSTSHHHLGDSPTKSSQGPTHPSKDFEGDVGDVVIGEAQAAQLRQLKKQVGQGGHLGGGVNVEVWERVVHPELLVKSVERMCRGDWEPSGNRCGRSRKRGMAAGP